MHVIVRFHKAIIIIVFFSLSDVQEVSEITIK